ncbi:hypothetical protein D9758_011143 [Tetrapyrgos nigripes]|uniref:Uncharacterized protein n=1 Tax=Tetrapyrgos nigripes TaxID=182062 RepID=A0A8H5CJW2_9AGAR|nr:hypothetical protein D9758_011143 [Tetrapyrgos nigripes]
MERLHDEWMMKYWPFSSEKKRSRIPFMNLAGFSTWCAPAADFNRMVWGARIAGIFFLADDYIDSGKMLDRIPGFKTAATGTGPLHEEDQAEICHDIVFRAIKATSHPRTFDQLTKCTHEWWDSNIHEPFKNLDQYLAVRRVNIAMQSSNPLVFRKCGFNDDEQSAYFRYTLDINLTDEQINHPLMREAEGIVSDHVGLTNDFFSYLKEKMTNSDDTNIVRILMEHENLTYPEAKVVIEKKIRQKEQDFIGAGMAVLNDPSLGKIQKYISGLQICNTAWAVIWLGRRRCVPLKLDPSTFTTELWILNLSQSGRYNVGDIDGITFPSLSWAAEPTPEDEVVDDTEESLRRDKIFNVDAKDIPPPDFTIDDDEIFLSNPHAHIQQYVKLPERPKNVGIIGLEVSIPEQYIAVQAFENTDGVAPGTYSSSLGPVYFPDTSEDKVSIIFALLEKYNINPHAIGRVDTIADCRLPKSAQAKLERSFDEGAEFTNSKGITSAIFNARVLAGMEGYALVFGRNNGAAASGEVALLIGPDAPLVLEPIHGASITSGTPASLATYLKTLDKSLSAYERKVEKAAVKAEHLLATAVKLSDFDFSIFESPKPEYVQKAYSHMTYHDFVAHPPSSASRESIPASMDENSFQDWNLAKREINGTPIDQISKAQYTESVIPSQLLSTVLGNAYASSLYAGLASLLTNIPSYELFDKRISMFQYDGSGASTFFAIRVRGDTSHIQRRLDLKSRLAKMDLVTPSVYQNEARMEVGTAEVQLLRQRAITVSAA